LISELEIGDSIPPKAGFQPAKQRRVFDTANDGGFAPRFNIVTCGHCRPVPSYGVNSSGDPGQGFSRFRLEPEARKSKSCDNLSETTLQTEVLLLIG